MQNLTSKIDEICQVDIHLGFMDFTCRQTGLRLYHTNASYRHHSITVLKIISYPILYFNVWNSRYWRNFNICLLSQLCQPLFSTQMTTCKLQYDWSSIFPDFLGLPLEFSSRIKEKSKVIKRLCAEYFKFGKCCLLHGKNFSFEQMYIYFLRITLFKHVYLCTCPCTW